MSLLFYAVKPSDANLTSVMDEGLNSYRKRINLRHNSVLTKNERLVVTTMLLDNTFCGFD